jgi:hypothetical protein
VTYLPFGVYFFIQEENVGDVNSVILQLINASRLFKEQEIHFWTAGDLFEAARNAEPNRVPVRVLLIDDPVL